LLLNFSVPTMHYLWYIRVLQRFPAMPQFSPLTETNLDSNSRSSVKT
jgi:hypothetical protein